MHINRRPGYQKTAHGKGYDVRGLFLSGVCCTAQREIFTRDFAYFTL